jgi:DNA-binding GntR family transcriptional regulator
MRQVIERRPRTTSRSGARARPSRASTVRGAFPSSLDAIDRRMAVAPQVHRILREAIVSAHLGPGQTLSEMDLALELGVSRTPVREAFIRLAMEGLVGVFPQLGTIVAPIDVDAVVEAQFVREVLEVAAARLACSSSDPSQAAPLVDNLEAQAKACDDGNVDRFHELDDELHRTIFEQAGHPAAWRVVHSAKPQLDRVRHLTLPDASTRLHDLAEHRAIVEAITAGDAEAAEEAVRRHARAILGQLPLLREQFPQYFAEPR